MCLNREGVQRSSRYQKVHRGLICFDWLSIPEKSTLHIHLMERLFGSEIKYRKKSQMSFFSDLSHKREPLTYFLAFFETINHKIIRSLCQRASLGQKASVFQLWLTDRHFLTGFSRAANFVRSLSSHTPSTAQTDLGDRFLCELFRKTDRRDGE